MAELRKYETVFIARPNLTEDEFTALLEKINEGHYVLINFEAPVDFPAELERVYNITDTIMRSLTVSKEEK